MFGILVVVRCSICVLRSDSVLLWVYVMRLSAVGLLVTVGLGVLLGCA